MSGEWRGTGGEPHRAQLLGWRRAPLWAGELQVAEGGLGED